MSKKGRTATTTMPRVFWCLAYLYLNTSNQVQPRNKLQNLSHAALLAKFHRAGNLQERHFLQAVGRRSVAYGHAVAAEESSPLLLCSNRGAIGSFLLPCQENSRLNKSCPAKVLLCHKLQNTCATLSWQDMLQRFFELARGIDDLESFPESILNDLSRQPLWPCLIINWLGPLVLCAGN